MLRKMLTRKMLTILCLGLAAGIPLGVVLTVLQAWMTKSGIDLKTVGLAGLVQMPYTWKFVWSPLMDRFVPPFLGRRRGWMLVSQVLMIVSIVAMGQFDPATPSSPSSPSRPSSRSPGPATTSSSTPTGGTCSTNRNSGSGRPSRSTAT